MASNDEIAMLIQKRRSEAAAEQARAQEAARRQQEQHQQWITLLQNFHLRVGSILINLVISYNNQLRDVGSLTAMNGGRDGSRYEVTYVKHAGGGRNNGRLVVELLDGGNLEIKSDVWAVPMDVQGLALQSYDQEKMQRIVNGFVGAILV